MDIELQTLIEQDIDLYKNNYYVSAENQNLIDDPKQRALIAKDKPTTFFNEFGELDFKHEDILSTTKYIEEEKVADDYNVFVEEDTGNKFFKYFRIGLIRVIKFSKKNFE
jgi:hypothetical protein